MISDRNIVCISNPTWEGNYAKTIVELMKVFARKNKVLYVDNPHTVKTLVDGVTGKAKLPLKVVFGFEKRLRKIELEEGAVYVLRPPMILTINHLKPGKTYDRLLQLNAWIVRRSIKKALHQLNMEQGIINFISLNPWLGLPIARKLNEQHLIYHCYDELAAATWYKVHGPRLEKILMKKVDAVIVTSEGLYERKKGYNPSCYLVKNAVNAKLYSQGFDSEVRNKKVIGYIGSVDSRVDYELVEYLATSLSDYQFIFIGRVRNPEGEVILRRNKNIQLEGAKDVSELPAYLKKFSIGIIPFKRNDFTKNIYPLKINEYLAAGVPVVTTNFSYLDEFKNIVQIVDEPEAFKQHILQEITTDTLEKKLQRREVAFSNSWDHRAEEISNVIEILDKKSNQNS